jgi:hypothetical protein
VRTCQHDHLVRPRKLARLDLGVLDQMLRLPPSKTAQCAPTSLGLEQPSGSASQAHAMEADSRS